MQFQYHQISTLPPLAWCARVEGDREEVLVWHGRWVETHARAFVEGAWNDSFASLNFTAATVFCGTGGILEQDQVRFSGSTDRLSPLFSIRKAGSVYVSNSPAFVMTAAGEAPDDIYPFHTYDLVRIWRQGLYCQDGHLRLRSTVPLRVHFSTILSINKPGSIRFDTHRLGASPQDYPSYKALLLEGVSGVLQNAADATRRRSYRPLAALSRGYDSSATAALASWAGCREAFSFTDSRSKDPRRDSGAENAPYLGMTCAEYERWWHLGLDRCVEAEFGYSAVASNTPLAALEHELGGRILVAGNFGDSIWEAERAKVCNHLSQTWARFMSGLSQMEFRLRVGYHVFAPACIGARHNQAIHRIATSDEMRAWSIGGDYDRPLPRRIAEEAGLPRDRFGMRKGASGHVHFTGPTGFSQKGLSDYRQFVRERHAEISWSACCYWRSRALWRQLLWQAVGARRKRFVPPSPLQRRFPFVLNVAPRRIPWDFMFTFQWASASLQPRYALPAQLPRGDGSAAPL